MNLFNLNNNQPIFRAETLDYIPIVSIASGATRATFGMLQIFVAPMQDVLSLANFCLHPSQGLSIDGDTSLNLRGKANMIRGSIAMCPIFGNITVYLFDHSSSAKNWELRAARSLMWVL